MPRLPFAKEEGSISAAHRNATDRGLIAACLSGDATAWDALIGRYAALVFSVSLRMGLSHADAEDLFQDVCVILLNHLSDLRDTSKLSSWLISTTRREGWRLLKRRNSTSSTTELGEFGWEMEGAESLHGQTHGNDPEAEMMVLEEQQLMRQAMTRLPDRCRTLLELLYIAEEPASYQEISSKFSLPVGSIGPTRARCLQNLKKLLQELGY